jgi:hypothetical protein
VSLASTVSQLRIGQKVRVSLRTHERPLVGVLRGPSNVRQVPDQLGDALFLDTPTAPLIRNPYGAPGWGLRWVEELPAGGLEKEEQLELVDARVDDYLTALAAWEQASTSEKDAALEAARAAYTACLEAMAPPFEVAS